MNSGQRKINKNAGIHCNDTDGHVSLVQRNTKAEGILQRISGFAH